MDNGKSSGHNVEHRHTKLTVSMMELGITIYHSQPYHPRTMGTHERFHRTFKKAIQSQCEGRLIEECQPIVDNWRDEYNTKRPHQALEIDVPDDNYEPSDRSFPETIREWNYADSKAVRKVSETGIISFQGRFYPMGTGFAGKHIGLEETNTEDEMIIKFREFGVDTLNLDEDQLDY